MTGAKDCETKVDLLQREAVAWVRRLTSGQATATDAEAFKLWFSQSSAHAAAFSTASRLWKDLEPAGHNWRKHEAASALASSRRRQPELSRRFVLGGALAAASAASVYAVVHPPLGLWPSLTELKADYRTATGEQREVSLSDNVSIRMNTQTSIAVQPFDNDAERIELIAGEASFSAGARSGRPLAVLAANHWITADEAQFDVRRLHGRTEETVCVTCSKGTLRIEGLAQATTITAGQQLRYDSRGGGHLEAVDRDIATAWQRGLLIFRFTPLTDVVDEINRYRPGRVVIINQDVGRIPVSGRFRTDNMSDILTRIEQALDVKARFLPGGLVLLS